MTWTPGSFSRLGASRSRALAASLAIVGAIAIGLPQSCYAEATPGPEAKPGAAGLPEGRVYEEVSPANKLGNLAGEPSGQIADSPYIVAGVDGNEVVYSTTGPMGRSPSGFSGFTIARRSSAGWQSHAALSRGVGVQGLFRTNPQEGLGFSADMAATVFIAPDVFVSEQENNFLTPHIYRSSEDGEVQWLGRPTISEPVKAELFDGRSFGGELAGASSDLERVYFEFEGALVPADEEPDPKLGDISYTEELRTLNESTTPPPGDDGFYEWHEGTLEAAGVLPDGHIDPYGAKPAAIAGIEQAGVANGVSEDGSDAFFLSPDPESHSGRPSELYVRKTAHDGTQSTALVSRDLLLPAEEGLPAGAPSGIGQRGAGGVGGSYVYASPDGSHAFFESVDQLTDEAPADATRKIYEFDTETDTLTYLAGLEQGVRILASSRDGSNFLLYEDKKLELWNEGSTTEISPAEFEAGGNSKYYPIARATPSGSVYVFESISPFSKFGFNNGNGKYQEIYRYETASNSLDCVSCPPAGTAPSGDAYLTHSLEGWFNTFHVITGNHGISEDGDHVFFDTPDALASQDTNGMRDAYEWENGVVSLISTGVSPEASFFGDNSPGGNDIFFSTSEGIAPGDTDEGYDVYDARVPRPGDRLSASAVPCEGSVCQGPPSTPQLLFPPASETFNGLGNIAPSKTQVKPKSLTREQKLKRALQRCKHEHKRGHERKSKRDRKRKRCRRSARRRYGAVAARAASRRNKAADAASHGNHGERGGR